VGGAPHANPLAMSQALAQAAVASGMGLTLLPVLYERAGFMQATLREDQRRFATTVDSVLDMRDGVRAPGCRVCVPVWPSTRCARRRPLRYTP
jgi:formimidoylglutamate deiminase